MKIAFVYDCVYPYSKGGVEKRNFEIGRRLNRKHSVYFLTRKVWKGGDEKLENELIYISVGKPRNIYAENEQRRSIWQSLLFALSLFKLFKYSFDVIECSSIIPLSVIICRLYAAVKRKKLIVTWHEVWTYSMWRSYLGLLLGAVAYGIDRIAFLLAKNVVFVTDQVYEGSKNFVVIPNGISQKKIKENISSKKRYDLVFAGRLIPHKNPLFYLSVVKRLTKSYPGLRCALIGSGMLQENVKNYIDDAHITQVVDCYSDLSDKDFFRTVGQAKIFVLPSTREGFGIAVLEALALGLYVVTTNDPNNAAREFVSNPHLGVTLPLDEDSFVKKIYALLTNEEGVVGNIDNQEKRIDYAFLYDWGEISDKFLEFAKDKE